jgi:hypothetical protein
VSDVDVTLLQRRIAELEQRQKEAAPSLKSGGSDGTSDGMEARLAKVESALEFIGREMTDAKTEIRTLRDHARTDFRVLFGAIIIATLGLAGLMAKGFHWI